jgi:hypothetical protein
MQIINYFPPILGKREYNCPHCNVYAKQFYGHMHSIAEYNGSSIIVDRQSRFREPLSKDWIVTKCQHCQDIALWHGMNMIYPKKLIAPPPNPDLAEEIKADYLEAANILAESPRAAAALLRLALQKLCIQLNEKGKNINEDIKSLVAKGLFRNPLMPLGSQETMRLTQVKLIFLKSQNAWRNSLN